MNFFPLPYPDEIFYSTVARYCIRSGNIRTIQNLEDLFGTRNCIAVMELPSKLDAFISNLPVKTKYTVEYFMYNHTLFPYYSAFIPKERADQIISTMKKGEGCVSYIRLGLLSSTVKLNQYFRFCPECLKEDIKLYDEAYWHRLHQATGVFVCSKHKIPIYDSKELIRGVNRQKYNHASENNCIITQVIDYSVDLLDKLLSLAEDIDILLNANFGFRTQEWFKSQFRIKLIEKGYARMNNFIHQKKLKQDFIDFYGNEFLTLTQSKISASGECWLTTMVQDNNRVTHPMRYLLLARFLEISLSDLFNTEFEISDEAVGYLDTSKDTYKKLWEERLFELTKKNLSIREIAGILKSTPKTVRSHIDRLGIAPFWKFNGGGQFLYKEYKDTERFIVKRDESRAKWLKLLSDFPDKSSNQIRKSNEGLYSWVYRYDTEWLHKNIRAIKTITTTVDWVLRDFELNPKVKAIVEEMRKGKPQRICWSTIAGNLGNAGWLSKKKDKIPLTRAYIESVQESITDFQIRKIRWAAEELEKRGMEITKWNIIEISGVKPIYFNSFSDEIKDIFKDNALDIDY